MNRHIQTVKEHSILFYSLFDAKFIPNNNL